MSEKTAKEQRKNLNALLPVYCPFNEKGCVGADCHLWGKVSYGDVAVINSCAVNLQVYLLAEIKNLIQPLFQVVQENYQKGGSRIWQPN